MSGQTVLKATAPAFVPKATAPSFVPGVGLVPSSSIAPAATPQKSNLNPTAKAFVPNFDVSSDVKSSMSEPIAPHVDAGVANVFTIPTSVYGSTHSHSPATTSARVPGSPQLSHAPTPQITSSNGTAVAPSVTASGSATSSAPASPGLSAAASPPSPSLAPKVPSNLIPAHHAIPKILPRKDKERKPRDPARNDPNDSVRAIRPSPRLTPVSAAVPAEASAMSPLMGDTKSVEEPEALQLDKRVYSRDELLSLKAAAENCTSLPQFMIDLMARKGGRGSSQGAGSEPNWGGSRPDSKGGLRPGGGSKPMTRGKMPGGPSRPGGGGQGRGGGRGGGGGKFNDRGRGGKGGGGGGRGRKDDPMDIEIKPLEATENRYVVLHDIAPDEKLLRVLQSILNKLTPEKLNILVGQVVQLEINTAAMFRDVVKSVFDKALAEPVFSATYTDFCVALAKQLPTFDAQGVKIPPVTSAPPTSAAAAVAAATEGKEAKDTSAPADTTFKRLLLNMCQAHFEASDRELKEIEMITEKEAHDEKLATFKRRILGLIRFIGELFQKDMISPKIMQLCVSKLLGDDRNPPPEEDIEALCKLLTTIGKKLSKVRKAALDAVFLRMEELANATPAKLPSRIRFMIKDVLDLRAAKWVDRRKADKAVPVKLSEVHQEGSSSDSNKLRKPMQAPPVTRTQPRTADRYSLGKPPASPKKAAGADDWEQVGSTKKWKTGGGSSDVRLEGRSAWQGASSQSSNQPSSKRALDKPSKAKDSESEPARGNVFAMLNDDDAGDRNETADADAEGDAEPEEGEVADADADAGASDAAVASAAVDDDAPISEVVIKGFGKKVGGILQDFYASNDFKDTCTCLREVSGPQRLRSVVVRDGLRTMMEVKDAQRSSLSKLFVMLFKDHQFLLPQHFTTGFNEYLEAAEEEVLDYPKLTDYVGAMLGDLVLAGIMSLDYLATLKATSYLEAGSFRKVTSAALKKILAGSEGNVAAKIKELIPGSSLSALVGADVLAAVVKDQSDLEPLKSL